MATDLEDKQGNETSVETPDSEQAYDDREFGGMTSPENNDNDSLSAQDLKDREVSAGNDPSASDDDSRSLGQYNQSGPSTKFGAAAKFLAASKKKKALIGGGVGGVFIALIIVGLMSLLPLKIMHIMNNLQDQFFAASEEATEDISDKLFRQYIISKVIPGMVSGSCSSTRVSKSCAKVTDTGNPISALYLAWSNANLEGKLYDRNGIEIVRDGKKFYFRSDSLRERIFLGEYNEANSRDFNNRAYTELSRGEVRHEVKKALEGETLRKRMMYRYSVGNLLERKYGIKRCLIACQARDKRQDKIEARKLAFKLYLSERVLVPRSEAIGLALECALTSFKCTDVSDEADENGERRSDYERDLQARLLDYRSRFGTQSLDELQTESDRISQNGFTDYVIRRIAGDTAGRLLTKSIPIVGWVDFGAQIVSSARTAGPAIQKMNYVMNTTSMVAMYGMYRTVADETKVGHPELQTLGSMSDSFSSNPLNDQGGAGAESSPLYGAIMKEKTVEASAVAGFLVPYTSASSEKKIENKCDDGQPYPAGKLVCPEVSFDKQSTVGKMADTVSAVANSPLGFFAGTAATVWQATGGAALDLLAKAIGFFVSPLVPSQIEDIVAWVQDNVFTKILVNPITDKPSGSRSFEMAAGGANVAGNDYAHYGLGAPKATPLQVSQIRNARIAEKEYEFSQRPLYARLFSTEDSSSLASRVAISIPSSSISESSGFASTVFNPFTSLFSGFGAIFSGKKASATTNFQEDPFGIDQYAWPASHEVFADETDLEKYWEQQNCSDPEQVKKWGDSAQVNPDNLVVSHSTGNPCLLMQAGAEISGGKYEASLIKNPVSDNGATVTNPNASGNPGEMFAPSDQKKCAVGQDGGVQDGYNNGKLVKIRICIVEGIDVNVNMEKNLHDLLLKARADGITLSAGGFRTMAEQQDLYNQNCRNGKCSPATARPGYSNHQMGLAFDFRYKGITICFKRSSANCNGHVGFDWLKANAANYGLKNLPKEAWHWSVDGT